MKLDAAIFYRGPVFSMDKMQKYINIQIFKNLKSFCGKKDAFDYISERLLFNYKRTKNIDK